MIFGLIVVRPYWLLYQSKFNKELLFSQEQKTIVFEQAISFTKLGDKLVECECLLESDLVDKLVVYKNYDQDTLQPGKYILLKKWTTNELVNQLYLMRNLGMMAVKLICMAGKQKNQLN